jgi:hypothetical protein
MQLTVKIESEKVRRSLKNVGDAIPKIGFRVLWRLMTNAKERAQKYPPELPNQRYIRTGIYGRSFKLIKLGTGIIGARLESDAVQKGRHYTVNVGGNYIGHGQALIHEGRWVLIRDAVEHEAVEKMVAEVEADMGDILQMEGMGS